MKDQLINFDVAKLAKEKGFKEYCIAYFSISGEEMYFREDGMYFHSNGANGRLILRPTQSLLQKWLREEYGIDILFKRSFSDGKKKYILTPCFDKPRLKGYDNAEENTYEEALEIALIIALNMIK